MIDLHCHVLPGVDDGPASMEQALAELREHLAAGVTTVAATSHVSYEWPQNTADRLRTAVAGLHDAAAAAGIGIAIEPAAEVALTRAVELDDEELARLRLGAGPWLLVEPPHIPVPATAIEHSFLQLMHRGHRVVIAHPERCAAFQEQPDVLERLVRGGALTSVTASSLTGAFGRTVQRFAMDLAQGEMVHNVASDAHGGSRSRRPGISGHVEQAGLGPLLAWLAEDVPAAILSGEAVPARPDVPVRAGRSGLMGRLRGRR